MSASFRSADLGLSAFLRSRGHRITTIERNGGGRSTFVFTESPKLQADVTVWINEEESSMSARRFFDNLRDLKGVTATS